MVTEQSDLFKGRDFIGDRGYAANPIYVSDLDKCLPASALSTEPRWRKWRTLEYETDRFSGVMLLAGPETAAPEVTYPLAVSGWHAVSIGVYGDQQNAIQILARLSGDDASAMLMLRELGWEPGETEGKMKEVSAPGIRELFWKVADLTGQELMLGQQTMRVASGDGPGSLKCSDARIAYVKLVPLSEAEVDALQEERNRTDTRRLFGHSDSHVAHYGFRLTTAAEVRRQIEPYRDTDFSRIYFEAGGGDMLMHLSRIGRIPTLDGIEDFGRQGDRMFSESWRIFRDKGVNPFQVALEHAHSLGLEFHGCYRVAGFHSPPPLDREGSIATFYRCHPELRGVDRSGNRTPRLAYTYPEVRRLVVSLLREIAEYGVDGIGLWYNRRPPLVEYEPPLIEGFTAEYGEDPRQLDDKDWRWLSYRARTLTRFMREVRQAMDGVAEDMGRSKRIEITAITMSNEEENLLNAMDLRAWVGEDLVDTLIPYTHRPNLDGASESWTDARDLEFFTSLTDGTSCKLAPNIRPQRINPEAYRRRAHALYDAGVQHLFFWDSAPLQRAHYGDDWNALRRLGHQEEIAAWKAVGEPSLAGPSVALRKLGDWDLSYETPG